MGIYSVDRTGEATDPTSGVIRLGPAPVPISAEHAEKEYQRKQAERDHARSALALKFADQPGPRKRVETQEPGKKVPEVYEAPPELVPELEAFLHSSALCNLATLRFDERKHRWQATGDPTEVNIYSRV